MRATQVRLRDAGGNGPRSIAVGPNGSLPVTLWSLLVQIDPSGNLHVVAENGHVLRPAAHRSYPSNVAATAVAIAAEVVTLDPKGNVFLIDDTRAIREVLR